MSKKMKEVVGKEEIMRILEQEQETRANGIVQRIRDWTVQLLEIESEISLGRLNRIISKLEGREVDYSVVRYAILKMDGVEVFKKGKVNYIRRK